MSTNPPLTQTRAERIFSRRCEIEKMLAMFGVQPNLRFDLQGLSAV